MCWKSLCLRRPKLYSSNGKKLGAYRKHESHETHKTIIVSIRSPVKHFLSPILSSADNFIFAQ